MRSLGSLASLAAVASLVLAPATTSASSPKIYPPRGSHEAGVALALVDDAWADDGLGVAGHYEMVLARNAGPGHVMGGGVGLVAMLDERFRGCQREETILSAAGRVRYVLGFSNVVRPYAGIGLGLYAVSRDIEECDPDFDRDVDERDLGIGIPIVLGLDFQFDALLFGVSFNFHDTSAGGEDFNHVGMGVAWKF